jgi:hypothetical protein
MQTERYPNGDVLTRILNAPTDEMLRQRLKVAHSDAIDRGAVETAKL